MTCQDDGDRLVAKLLVGHMVAIFIFSQHQHGQQIALVFVGETALVDDAHDDVV